jgi:hypothetical protein
MIKKDGTMDCAGIQELLSEYIDGTLDEKTVQMVEKHISFCEDCKETLASLSAIVEELNTLEQVKPPEDFLEKIHQRMETRFDFNQIIRKLFVPFKTKIPLQLAAVATASVLVVLVFNLQKSEYQKMHPLKTAKSEWFAEKQKPNHLTPESKTKRKPSAPVLEETPERLSDSEQGTRAQRFKGKTGLEPYRQKGTKPHPSVLAKAGLSAQKDQPLKLALILNPLVIGHGYESDSAVQPKTEPEKNKKAIEKEMTDKNSLKREFMYNQRRRIDNLMITMNHIIQPLNGKILTQEYDKQKDRLTSIHVQMPTKNYPSFFKELSQLGTFKTPPPVLPSQRLETLDLLINFTYPE